MAEYKILSVDIGSADINLVKDKLLGANGFAEAQYLGRHDKTNLHIFIMWDGGVPIFLGNAENMEYDDISIDSICEVGNIVHDG